MNMELKELMTVVGYGTKVIIVDAQTDEELLNTVNFTTPYALKGATPKDEFTVVCVGVKFDTMMIWVKRR